MGAWGWGFVWGVWGERKGEGERGVSCLSQAVTVTSRDIL